MLPVVTDWNNSWDVIKKKIFHLDQNARVFASLIDVARDAPRETLKNFVT